MFYSDILDPCSFKATFTTCPDSELICNQQSERIGIHHLQFTINFMPHPKESVLKSKSYQYALHYLSRYPKTRKELEMKLLQKGFSYENIQETIDTLEMQNIVNDAKFAESYVYSECVKKGKPIVNIRNKLYHKGISREIIDDIMKESSEGMEHGISEKIIKEIEQYKKRGIEGLEIISKLMRKGYQAQQIKDAIALRDRKE